MYNTKTTQFILHKVAGPWRSPHCHQPDARLTSVRQPSYQHYLTLNRRDFAVWLLTHDCIDRLLLDNWLDCPGKKHAVHLAFTLHCWVTTIDYPCRVTNLLYPSNHTFTLYPSNHTNLLYLSNHTLSLYLSNHTLSLYLSNHTLSRSTTQHSSHDSHYYHNIMSSNVK